MPETWSIRLLKAALKIQDRITPEVSNAIKKSGAGRKARLLIEGDDGGEMYLKWNGERLVEEPDAAGVRNDLILHAQTLFDLSTGELGAREALAARLIRITGDRSIYDQEDIMQLFEKLQDKIIFYLTECRS
jgi:putative sterol carrier protein